MGVTVCPVWGSSLAVILQMNLSLSVCRMAGLGYALSGMLVGLISVGALPGPFFSGPQVRGLGLVLSPLLTSTQLRGRVTHRNGKIRPLRQLGLP